MNVCIYAQLCVYIYTGMGARVCMYVGVLVCMYVCMCVCIYTYVTVRTTSCIYVHIHVHIHVHILVHIHIAPQRTPTIRKPQARSCKALQVATKHNSSKIQPDTTSSQQFQLYNVRLYTFKLLDLFAVVAAGGQDP